MKKINGQTEETTAVTIIHEDEFSVSQVKAQIEKIAAVMKETMKDGEHYGVIPGTNSKPVLFKAGAEKLALTFRLAPSFEVIERDLPNGHRDYRVQCRVTHISSGRFLGEGVGSCSTMEGKYRFRNETRTCPICDAQAIIKGKADYGGGWLCFDKKGGCGEKWADGSEQAEIFVRQKLGKVEHDNPADYYNTALKMAKKRAQVDATLTVTAASDFFTQDPDMIPGYKEPQSSAEPVRKGEAKEMMTDEQLHTMRDLIDNRPGIDAATEILLRKAIERGGHKHTIQRIINKAALMVETARAQEGADVEGVSASDIPF